MILSVNFPANGENAAHGNGITKNSAAELFSSGVDVITLGNHAFNRSDVSEVFDEYNFVIRPANYLKTLPGEGSIIYDTGVFLVGVINLQGQVFLEPINSPFEAAEKQISKLKEKTNIIIVDFHAEATSEKGAMAYFLDGKVSAVLGTHTHVQTADSTILPNGTAFISDVGMTGPFGSILGVDKDVIVDRFVNHINRRFEPGINKAQFNAVVLDIDNKTGKCNKIERLNF